MPSYNLTPTTCPNELVLTATLSDGSPLPVAISYSAPNISVYTTDYAMTNVYKVRWVATDPKTGIMNSAVTLKVTIKCTKKVDLVSGAIANFDYRISLTAPYTMSVPLPQY